MQNGTGESTVTLSGPIAYEAKIACDGLWQRLFPWFYAKKKPVDLPTFSLGQRCLPRGFALAREGKQGVSRRRGRRYRFFVIVEHRINRRAASGARIEDYILHAATACVEKSHRPGVRG